MASTVRHITVDCADPQLLAAFWSQALDGSVHPDSDDEDALVEVADGPGVLFLQVPEGKTVKNRMHLDLQPNGVMTREGEVARLCGLGATVRDDQRRSDGSGFVVLADPEDNEFCVERSEAERAGS